jgi:hypothetical protein
VVAASADDPKALLIPSSGAFLFPGLDEILPASCIAGTPSGGIHMPFCRLLAVLLLLVGMISPAAAADGDFLPADPDAKAKASAAFGTSQFYVGPVTQRLVRPSTDEAGTIPLTIIKLAGSKWTDKLVLDEIRMAERVYGACGVSFSPISLVDVETTYDLDELGIDPYKEMDVEWARVAVPRDLDLVKGLGLPRPLIILRDKGKSYSFSPLTNQGSEYYQPLEGVSFLTHFAIGNNLGDAQTLAHELGHTLLNEDHNSRKGNVLYCNEAGDVCEGTKLTAAQCDKLDAWK